jgi:predicted alpha/beta superfamily hydrolase
MKLLSNLISTIIFCFLLAYFPLNAQIKNIIPDSIQSHILNETRRFQVYLPKEILDKNQKQTHYPVLYVLDGESYLLPISGMMQYLTEANGNRIFPKMIVVFLNNTNRTRDLTPYPTPESVFLPKVMADQTGGGEKFIQVLEKEIFPYIDAKYPTSSYRSLIGHSFGGIFALSVLAKHPHLFEDYLVMDPSLWYDHQKFAKDVFEKISQSPLKGKSLYVSIANTTNEKDLNKVIKNKATFAQHEKSILQFCQKMQANKSKSIQFSYQYFPCDDHSSVPFISIYEGLRTVFKNHQLSPYETINPHFDPLKRIQEHYEKLAKKIKTPIKVSSEELEYFIQMSEINQNYKAKDQLKSLYQQLYPKEYAEFMPKN